MSKSSMALVSILAVAAPAAARDPAVVALIDVEKAQPGQERAFEEARKQHMQWHRAHGDAWTWQVWEVVTGPRSGSYVVGTFGHHWEEFDTRGALRAEDHADAEAKLDPLLASSEETYWVFRGDLSRPPDDGPPSAMAELVRFQLRPESRADFVDALRKIRSALDRSGWPGRFTWYELAIGGEQPTFVETIPRDSWAGMEPAEPSLESALEKAYGRQEAEALLKRLGADALSKTRTMLRYRGDLSYVPQAR